MPKEYINSRTDADDTFYRGDPAPFAEVSWCRHRDDGSHHVQIATLAGGDYNEAETPRPGFYVSLDRDGINRAIRTLRRARDAAFGSDA